MNISSRFLLSAGMLLVTLPLSAQTPGVGIGTTNPTAPLHVASAQTYQVSFGPNIAGQATVTASSVGTASGLSVANATDGNQATYWAGRFRQPYPHWLQLDFGSTPRMIRQYTVYLGQFTGIATYSYAAATWDFQASQDGSTWTTLHQVTSLPSRTSLLTYSVRHNATAYRYYRLLITSGSFTPAPTDSEEPPALAEWGVMEETGTAGVALRVSPGALQLQNGPAVTGFSLDPALADGGDETVPTQRAVKTYVDAAIATTGDNLGNHTATTALNMNGNIITGTDANRAGGGGIYINSAGLVGLGTVVPNASLAVRGGHNDDGTGGTPAMAFEWWGGLLRHWLVTRHHFGATGNAMDFYLNTDPTNTGPSAPGVNSAHVLTLLHENGPRVGVATTTPITQLANTSTDIVDPGNVGVGATSMAWAANTSGYAAAFFNSNTTGDGRGLAVKIAANTAHAAALDVSWGNSQTSVGTSLFRVRGDGRVGIGTASPAARLDVKGGADNDGNSDPVALAFQWWGGGYRHFIRTRHNAILGIGGNAFDFYVNNQNTAAGASGPGVGSQQVLTLDYYDGPRVGIGTTAPVGKLHIVNDGQGGGGADDYVFDEYGTGDQGIFFRHADGTKAAPANLTTGSLIGHISFIPRNNGSLPYGGGSMVASSYRGDGLNSLTDLQLWTSGSNRLYIAADGNVGIGTESTSAAQVVVNASAVTKNGLLVGLNQNSTAYSLKLEHNGSNLVVRPVSAGGTSTVVENTGGGSLVLNPSGGNIGIGTTAPAQKLDVAGTVQAQQFQYASSQTRYLTVPASAFISTNSAYSISTQVYVVGTLISPLRVRLSGGTAGQPGYVQAAVNLPDGAVVTGISFTAFDNDGSSVAPLASLTEVHQLDGGVFTNYSNVSGGQVALTTESPNWQTVTTPLAMTIDNANNTYQLIVRLNQNSTSTGFLNVRIAYTVAKPD